MRITVESHLVTIVKDGTARIYLADTQGNVNQMAQVTVPIDITPERAAVLALSISSVMDDAKLDMRVERAPRALPSLPLPAPLRARRRDDGPNKAQRLIAYLKTNPGADVAVLSDAADCHEAYVTMALKPYLDSGEVTRTQAYRGARYRYTWAGDAEPEPEAPNAPEATEAQQKMASLMELASMTQEQAQGYLVNAPGISEPELEASHLNPTAQRAIELIRERGAMNTTDIANELGISASYIRRTLGEEPSLVSHQNKESQTAPLIWTLREGAIANGQ